MSISTPTFNLKSFLIGPGFLRLVLALIVVFHHNTKYLKIGEFAVFAFFMLSGYWIHKMYKEKYNLLESPYYSFITSRWLRIYPTYIFNLLLVFLIIFVFKWSPEGLKAYQEGGDARFWFSNIALLTYNQLPVPLMFLVPAWSLDIELQFYIIFPLIFLALSRTKSVWVYLTCFLISVLANTVFHDIFKGTVVTGIHFFLVGSLLYVTDYKPGKSTVYISALLFLALLSVNYLHPGLRANMFASNRDLMWLGMNYHELFNTALAVVIIPILAANVKQPSPPTDRLMGNLSYDIYLFHWVLALPYNFFFAHLPFGQRLPYFFVYFLITLGGSYLIYKFIDEPVERLRKKWLKETKKPVSLEVQEVR
ncbi:MAG: acyltransferase family protein [Adhaeribacter sp.]